MQRDYYANNSQSRTVGVEYEIEDRTSRQQASLEEERQIRDRYLGDEKSRIHSDFAIPLPRNSSNRAAHITSGRWSPRIAESPSSLLSPESPVDARALQQSYPHLGKGDLKMQYQTEPEGHLQIRRSSQQNDGPSASYSPYLPHPYRSTSIPAGPRMHEFPFPVHNPHAYFRGYPISNSTRSNFPQAPTLKQVNNSRDENLTFTHSGSLKQRISVRPPDLDFTTLERQGLDQLQRISTSLHRQSPQEMWKVPESPRQFPKEKDSGSSDFRKEQISRIQSTSLSHYPAHFVLGSLIQLSNGDLKRVEDLTTEDFVASAASSQDVGIDHSEIVAMKTLTENGSVIVGFSVGKHKTQVTVEAALEHPFFIIGHGWSSASPQHTLLRYKLPCQQLKIGDICISLVQRSQMKEANNFVTPMRPPPVPPLERESFQPEKGKYSTLSASNNSTRPSVSPSKQVAFSDRVTLHSPNLESPNSENGSAKRIKLEREDELTHVAFESTHVSTNHENGNAPKKKSDFYDSEKQSNKLERSDI